MLLVSSPSSRGGPKHPLGPCTAAVFRERVRPLSGGLGHVGSEQDAGGLGGRYSATDVRGPAVHLPRGVARLPRGPSSGHRRKVVEIWQRRYFKVVDLF